MRIRKLLVNEKATIKETMRVIGEGSVKMAIVVGDDDKLLGVITDGDVRRGILSGMTTDESIAEIYNKNSTYFLEDKNEEKIIDVLQAKEDLLLVPIINKDRKVVDAYRLSSNNTIESYNGNVDIRLVKRVLVIGGGGFIGSVLVRLLSRKGYKVNILDNYMYGKHSLKGIESDGNIKIFEGDTRHIEKITDAIQDVDAVVHLAELVGDPACALDPKKTNDINYLATKSVAEISKYYGINRFVYMSSCSVYGASKNDELLTEDSELNPVSLYAKMKIASERALKRMMDSSFRPTILRLSTVFGVSPRQRFDLVVNTLTAKALQDGKITLFGGDQWRPNVDVMDVARTILAVLEAPLEKVGGQVFNVGTEENNHTINDIGRIVKEVVPEAELVIQEKDVDKRDYKVDFSKLRNTLGIRMKYSVKDGVESVRKFIEENPEVDHTDKIYSNIKFLQDSDIY